MKTLPKGCDQQGRYPEAAEAATEIGVDDAPKHNPLRDMLEEIVVAVAFTAFVAFLIIVVGMV